MTTHRSVFNALLRATVLCAVCLALPAWAQPANMTVGEAVYHDTSQRLDHLPPANPGRGNANRQIPNMPRVKPGRFPDLAEPDGGLQSQSAGTSQLGPTPGPVVTAPGLSDANNGAVLGFRMVPPDVNGDIGLDGSGNRIYVQYINSIWGVFNVNGSLIAGPYKGNTFWQGFGGFCQTNNDGDPIVLYDDLAGRWVFSQFSIDQGVQCVAVSTTSDPLGPYHRYAFTVSPGKQNDYPKMGVWSDGTSGSTGQSAYTFTTRDFPARASGFMGTGVMERDQMLVGGAAKFIKFENSCVINECMEGQLPPHLAGPPPPAGTCPTFWTAVDAAYDDSPHANDGYRNHRLCVDWSNLANSTYSEGGLVLSGSNFDRNLGLISPVNGGENLHSLPYFTMYRAQYRWFGTYGSVVLNTTVDAGSERAGIRWAETRSADGDTGWYRQQDGTYAPADGLERWMGSIAQDQDGNIALGYTVAGSSLFPSVRYTTRMAGDASGTMPGGEVSCVEGTGAQTNSSNRWGDYSSMSVDPTDDCTFWYTQEYYETTGSFDFNTRICSFRIPDCGGPPTNHPPAVTITAPANGASFEPGNTVTFSATATDIEDGNIANNLSWNSSRDGDIGLGASISISNLSTGTHTITASVTDSGDPTATPATGQDSISVTIEVNDAPVVTITAPASGSSYTQGASIGFSGTAIDTEDGDLAANLSWTSSRDGTIGSGASFNRSNLSVGSHTITASVTDSGGKPGSNTVSLTINVAVPVSVHVASVATGTLNANRGSKYGTATVTVVNDLGQPVPGYTVFGDFGGSFNEFVSGGPTNSNGQATLQTTSTVKGPTVTFCVSNVTGGLPYQYLDSTAGTTCGGPPPAPQPPTVNITAPANGSNFFQGASITFTATANDPEDGNISGTIAWKEGGSTLHTGSSFSTAGLGIGSHTITATATDSNGQSGSDSITVTVIEAPVSVVMHVGDLDGSAVSAARNRWDATVTITVHSANHAAVTGATVNGSWSSGANGSGTCVTNGAGQCPVSKTNLKTNVGSVSFTVGTVTRTGDTYTASDNHDPDGDSSGTLITVSQP